MPKQDQGLWPNPQRRLYFERWLEPLVSEHGLVAASLRLASADASFRRYLRLDSSVHGTCIVMDAPPTHENGGPFVKIAQLLAQAGVHVPRVLDWDAEQGFMLLGDLGQETLLQVLQKVPDGKYGECRKFAQQAYQEAVEVLLKWQLASQPGVLPAYDRALLAQELALFPTWYVEKHRGVQWHTQQWQNWEETTQALLDHNLSVANVYVHRDFMARNLMVVANGPGPEEESGIALGVLDFQDAVYGPITYDIASLLRDAFISFEDDFVQEIRAYYWQRAKVLGLPVADNFASFDEAVEWMGLQRHLKVLGIFARLALRDGKPHYLADAPRFLAYVRATASRYPALAPLLHCLGSAEDKPWL